MEINVSTPSKVKEAGDRADEAFRKAYEANGNPPSGDPTTPVITPDAPSGSESKPSESANPPTSELPATQSNGENWEHKYKVIEGKYRAEVPRLSASNRELTKQLDVLNLEVAELKSQRATPDASLINEEDREKYGDDLLNLIDRATQAKLAPKLAEIEQLHSQLNSVKTETAQNAEVTFYDRLTKLVPDWLAMNEDSGFIAWLSEYDDFAGMSRQQLLAHAESVKDADRVARFFTQWKAQSNTQAVASNSSLESQVVPDSNRQVTPPNSKRFFTRAEIQDFYQRARRNEIPPKDMVAIEAEIQSALMEGRIR